MKVLTVVLLCLSLPLVVGAQTSTLNFGTTYQTIRGFGASTAWTAVLTNAQANAAWGTSGNQLGLTINRARIDPGGSANWGTELSNAKLATARGAIEFATPWTPPASMKTNGNVVGGSLSTGSYAAFATYLESFVTYMANNGVSLYAISMQNEPDFVPNYEGCGWTAAQMDTWVKNNSSVLTTKLMMPESASFNFSQSDATLNDSSAVGHVSIIAGHLYGATISYYTNAENHGKDVWATEHYLTPSGSQAAIGDAIAAAVEVHNSMTVGYYNAYVWWWIAQNSGGGTINYGLVDTSGNPTYYGYAIGQFSRFVRPGAVRVSATSPASGIYVSAYKSGSAGTIVAINSNSNASSVTFALQNLSASSATPYETSSAGGLMQEGAVGVSNNSFSYTLPGKSIVTFVTSGSGTSCTTKPNAPSGLTATATSSSSVNLGWSAVTPPANCSISSYAVYRSTTNGFTPSANNQVGTTSGTSFTDSGVSASTTYYYAVEAVDGAGSSAASSEASVTTPAGGGGGGGSINSSAWYTVTTNYNNAGLCLWDANGGTANGTALIQNTCSAGQYSPEWQFRAAATSGYYAVFNRYATALVWDDTGGGTANGTKVQMYTYGSGNANQEWQAVSLGNNLWKFVNLHSGLCLDSTASTGTGIQMQQYQCISGDTSQEFTLTQQ